MSLSWHCSTCCKFRHWPCQNDSKTWMSIHLVIPLLLCWIKYVALVGFWFWQLKNPLILDPIDTTDYINVNSPRLAQCATVTHIFLEIILARCTYSLYFILWTFTHSKAYFAYACTSCTVLSFCEQTNFTYSLYILHTVLFNTLNLSILYFFLDLQYLYFTFLFSLTMFIVMHQNAKPNSL